MSDQPIYTVGGAVPSNRIYIPRQADEMLCKLCRTGEFAYILTARQLGKSSLRRRIAQQLDAAGILAIDIDLTAIGTPQDAAAWYMGVLTTIEDILMEKDIILQTDVITFWKAHAHLGPTQRFTRFFLQVLLAEVPSQIVIFVDEIDTTLKMDYTDDFFAAIRYFYEARANHPEFQRLSFVLIGVATPTALINDPKRTPFNIGQCVHLTDFIYQEALPFASGLTPDEVHAGQVLKWVLDWTGGHPYLTQRLCNQLSRQTKETFSMEDVEQAVRAVFLEEGSHGDDNLKWLGDFLIRGAPTGQVEQVLTTYRAVYRGRAPVYDNPQSAVITHLKLSGLVGLQGNTLSIRNRIYQTVFNEEWVKEQWPKGWWASIPPAIKIASAVITVLFIALIFISGFAITRGAEARRERDRTNEQLLFATSRQLAALALTNLENEPELSAWLAIQAMNTKYTTESENALRWAIQALRTEQAWPFGDDQTELTALAISPDGTRLAVAYQYGQVKVWHHADATWEPAQTFVGDEVSIHDLAFSPNGQFLAILSGRTITLWPVASSQRASGQMASGQISLTLQADIPSAVTEAPLFTAVNFSLDNHYLAALDFQGRLHIWAVASGQLITTVAAHANPGEDIAFSPDSNLLATASQYEAVKLWDISEVAHPREITRLDSHQWGANAVAFSPDGKTLATGGRDTVTLLWDIAGDITQPRQQQKLIGHADQIGKITFSPNGKCLAAASLDRKVSVWDLDSTLPPLMLSGHQANVTGVVFAPTNQKGQEGLLIPCQAQLITAGHDGMIRVWNIGPSRELFTLAGHKDAVRSVLFSTDGRYLASASDDKTAIVWDVKAEQRLHSLVGHSDRVTAVAFSPDNAFLATASDDRLVKVWELSSAKEVQSLPTYRVDDNVSANVGLKIGLTDIKFSQDEQFLAVADTDGKVNIWPVELAPLKFGNSIQLEACNTEVKGIAFGPDAKHLAVACLVGAVTLWDLTTQQPTATFDGDNALLDIAFSPDRRYLATVGLDEFISLRDLSQATEFHLSGYQNRIHSVDFSANGQWLVTSGDDGIAQLYRVASGERLQGLPGNVLGVNDAVFSPDNNLIATAGEDGTIRLYVMGVEQLLALARARLIQPPPQAICKRYLAPEQCPRGKDDL